MASDLIIKQAGDMGSLQDLICRVSGLEREEGRVEAKRTRFVKMVMRQLERAVFNNQILDC